MRKLLISIALLPNLALAQNLIFSAEEREFGTSFSSEIAGSAGPAMYLPLNQSGPGFDSLDVAHNLLLRSTLEGGGAAPTGWTGGTGGTSTPVSSEYGTNGVAYNQTSAGVDRPYLTQSLAVVANTVYFASVLVEDNPNSIPVQQMITWISLPAGAVVSYLPSAAYLPKAGETVGAVLTVAGTAGTPTLRVGLGVSSAVAASLTFSRPAVEFGAIRGQWSPTTTTADTSYTVSNVSFDGRHNLLLRSDDLTVTWVKDANVTVTANQCSGPNGLTLDKVDNTAGTASATVFQTISGLVSGTGPWTVAFDVSPLSGTQTVSPGIAIGSTPTTCTCVRDDGVACSGSIVGTVCYTAASVPSSVRVKVTATATTATTAVTPFFHPASYGTTKGAACAGAAQLEYGDISHDYVPTTTVARPSVPLDSARLSWTENGATPAVLSNTLPTTASSGAAGPFSDANYYSNGTGADALDSASDRFGCVAFVQASSANNQTLVGNGLFNTAGYEVQASSGGTFSFQTNIATGTTVTAGGAIPLNSFSIGCWWRTGTAASAKLNLGTTTTNGAAGTEISGTGQVHYIGRYNAAGQSSNGTKILHVIQGLGACPTPPAPFAATCEGWATYQMKRQFGLLGTRGEEITFTRATTATNSVNGVEWNVPLGVPRVTTQGLLVERSTTNAALQSAATCVGGAVNAPWALTAGGTCTADDQVAPDGTTTMDTWTSAVSSDRMVQTVTMASGATFTASVWARKASAGTATVIVRCTGGVANTCGCGTSNGSACTASIAGALDCWAKGTAVGTTPVRVWAAATCSVATTTPSIYLNPGDYQVATGTASFWGAQVETGLTPTSYVPTAGTAVARNADVASVPWPISNNNQWCAEITAHPLYGSWTRPNINYLLSIGSGAGANSWRMTIATTGEVTFSVTDSDGSGGSANTPALSSGMHRLSGQLSLPNITPRVKVDGTASTGSVSGDITSGFGAFGTLFLGTRTPTGLESDSHIKDFKLYRNPNCY